MTIRIGMGLLALASTLLSGCASMDWSFRGRVECNNRGECKIVGEVEGKPKPQEKRGASPQQDDIAAQTQSDLIDTASFEIDVQGSSVGIPMSGLVTLELKDASAGVVIAANTFQWHRTGSSIRLSNPVAVNQWLASVGGSADAVTASLHPFQTFGGQGMNLLQASFRYGGIQVASSSAGWYSSGGCVTHSCQEY